MKLLKAIKNERFNKDSPFNYNDERSKYVFPSANFGKINNTGKANTRPYIWNIRKIGNFPFLIFDVLIENILLADKNICRPCGVVQCLTQAGTMGKVAQLGSESCPIGLEHCPIGLQRRKSTLFASYSISGRYQITQKVDFSSAKTASCPIEKKLVLGTALHNVMHKTFGKEKVRRRREKNEYKS